MTKIVLSAAIAATGSIKSLIGHAGAESSSGLGNDMDDHTLRDLGLTRFDINHELPVLRTNSVQ